MRRGSIANNGKIADALTGFVESQVIDVSSRRMIADSIEDGMVILRDLASSDLYDEAYPRLAGVLIDPGDEVLVIELPGIGPGSGSTRVVLGKLQRSEPASIAFEAPLAGGSLPSHLHTEADVTGLVGDLSTLTTDVAGKANAVHTHDTRYYTEAEVDALIAAISSTHNPTIFANASSDSTVVVGTSLVDALTTTIGPLLNGVVYDIELNVFMRGSIDTTGFIRAYARIGSGSSVIGTRTGTVGGERTIMASTTDSRTGSGATVALAARTDMSTSTGSVTGMHISARAIPRS